MADHEISSQNTKRAFETTSDLKRAEPTPSSSHSVSSSSPGKVILLENPNVKSSSGSSPVEGQISYQGGTSYVDGFPSDSTESATATMLSGSTGISIVGGSFINTASDFDLVTGNDEYSVHNEASDEVMPPAYGYNENRPERNENNQPPSDSIPVPNINPVVNSSSIESVNMDVTDDDVVQGFIGAEAALEHVSRNRAEIESIFSEFGISADEYTILTGFNEDFLKEGTGLLQEIHVYFASEREVDPLLIPRLGKIFSPYPGFLYSSETPTAVPFFRNGKPIYDLKTLLSSSETNLFDFLSISDIDSLARTAKPAGDTSASASQNAPHASGSAGGGNSRRGSERRKNHNDDQNSRGLGDDDDNEDKENDGKARVHWQSTGAAKNLNSVRVSTKARVCANLNRSLQAFQDFKVSAKLSSSSPSDFPRGCEVKFDELGFEIESYHPTTHYEQIQFSVKVNTHQQECVVQYRSPEQSREAENDRKETVGKVDSSSKARSFGGTFSPKPAVTALYTTTSAGSHAHSTETVRHSSSITTHQDHGAVWWHYSIDDKNDRENGAKFLAGSDANLLKLLPSATFEFVGDAPLVSPEMLKVMIASYWTLAPVVKDAKHKPKSSLGKLIKQRPDSSAPQLFNICQVVTIKMPYQLQESCVYMTKKNEEEVFSTNDLPEQLQYHNDQEPFSHEAFLSPLRADFLSSNRSNIRSKPLITKYLEHRTISTAEITNASVAASA